MQLVNLVVQLFDSVQLVAQLLFLELRACLLPEKLLIPA
jgi:hypothetical protein